MKLEGLISTLSYPDVERCGIKDRGESFITFTVDDVTPRCEHLYAREGDGIIREILHEKGLREFDFVAYGTDGDKIGYVGFDVLYQCILRCYSEHRPLVLSPDVIWLVINQALASWINNNAEKYRQLVVFHAGKKELEVEVKKDILTEQCDWTEIFENFYSLIEENTKGNIASDMICDFTTTNDVCKIASSITLMDVMKSYFDYTISYCICGIPEITLTGTPEDWRKLARKIRILRMFDLEWWYEYLNPIINEFIAASEGNPNLYFWQSIVMRNSIDDFPKQKHGCDPTYQSMDVDGWFLALFPFKDNKQLSFEKHDKDDSMESELCRVPFKYIIKDDVSIVLRKDMELWAGVIGVEENRENFGLTPKLGWFVRESHERRRFR